MSMVDLWPVIPLLVITAGALTALICGAVGPGRHPYIVAIIALLGAGCWALQPVPLPEATLPGVAFHPFARFFTVLFTLTGAATLLLSMEYNLERQIRGEEYPATVLFAVFGMCALVTASNLLILFLALEALSFAFYILVAIDLRKNESAEAGLKYLLQGAVASAFIAFGIALVYCGCGTLEIAVAMQGGTDTAGAPPLFIGGWGFIIIGFAFKVSLVPAHLWTPDVYQGAPTPVAAFLSTGSKGAALAALLLLMMPLKTGTFLHHPLWIMALLSMVVGNCAALVQTSLKRMLAYSSIAQMGYLALALLTVTREGYRAVVFYIVVYTVLNLAAFGALSTLLRSCDGEALEGLRGKGYVRPFPGAVLALAMFGLAGIPPTAGFIGKFFIFAAALRGGETMLAVIGILTAALSVFYYLRVVVNLYLNPLDAPPSGERVTLPEGLVFGACSVVIFFIGIHPGPLFNLVDRIIP